MQADATGNKEAIVPVNVAPESDQLSLIDKIQKLWEQKRVESTTLAGGRTQAVEEERLQTALNWAFEKLPVSLFPDVPLRQVVEIRSDVSIRDAVAVLSRHGIWSAPVLKVDAPEDATWMDRYLGMVDYAGLVLWILGATETAAAGAGVAGSVAGSMAGGTAGLVGAGLVAGTGVGAAIGLAGGAVAGAALGGLGIELGPGRSGAALASAMGGSFFEALRDTTLFQQTKVADIVGSFLWGPFLPVQPQDSLLSLLLLVSKYGLKSVPVVETGNPRIQNFITQSAIVRLLAECNDLEWFDSVAGKSVQELGLPVVTAEDVYRVEEDAGVLDPFYLMVLKGVGGVAVVTKGTSKVIGNISTRDIRFLIETPELFRQREALTVKAFMEKAKLAYRLRDEAAAIMAPPIVANATDSLKTVIGRLNDAKIHHLYITNAEGEIEGAVGLRDIIGQFVQEPAGFFDSSFTIVTPAPVSA